MSIASAIASARYFNPRSPRGERLAVADQEIHMVEKFQSTLPAWGATLPPFLPREVQKISIHAPRVGSDFFGI